MIAAVLAHDRIAGAGRKGRGHRWHQTRPHDCDRASSTNWRLDDGEGRERFVGKPYLTGLGESCPRHVYRDGVEALTPRTCKS
jgi:hypothetical protein